MSALTPYGHVESRLPPLIVEASYSFQIGGSERLSVDLAIEFSRRGYRVILISLFDRDGPMRTIAEAAGITCKGFGENSKGPLRRRLMWLEFLQFFRAVRPDVVHFQHAVFLNRAARAARLAGVQNVVMTEHTDEQFKQEPRYRLASARSCRMARLVTTVHAGIAEYMVAQLGLDAGKVRVIRNGIAEVPSLGHDERAILRKELGIPANSFTFIYVGRLHPDKDVPTLLQASRMILTRSERDFGVLVVGDGPERAKLERICRELEIGSRVTFMGARTDVRRLLAAGNAFVMTSRTEGLPIALLEAMSSGLPCIATRVGGIPELLEHGGGLLCDAGDSSGVAQSMLSVMVNEGLCAKLAHEARMIVEHRYGFRPMVNAYLEAFGLPEVPDRG